MVILLPTGAGKTLFAEIASSLFIYLLSFTVTI